MPYIKEDDRVRLDPCIESMISSIKNDNDLHKLLGDINYCFSRVASGVMGEVSYSKVAMITGVLENIKQEFYRRVASPYEDKKIIENGDIKEYY
jgi:hypothetical protein